MDQQTGMRGPFRRYQKTGPTPASAMHVWDGLLLGVFTATIFTSATLLFLIQPMFARMILPRLGGSAAVWNTASMFFQAALLAGYVYAHVTVARLGVRRQAALHLAVLALPLLVLPIALPQGWTPPSDSSPIPALLLLLLTTVGLPFFVVSASSPLLQAWFARTGHRAAADPYFLYAASNIGSMLGLLSYPFLIEPTTRLADQSMIWSIGYGVLALLMAASALLLWRASAGASEIQPSHAPTLPRSASGVSLSKARVARWVLLAFVPSSLMLSVTTHISTDVSPFPLLWVVPLALYLLTFIFGFAQRPPITQATLLRWLPLALLLSAIWAAAPIAQPVWLIPLQLLCFFGIALACHMALAQDRPEASELTTFYFWLSFGGMLGGMFNALAAPLLFSSVLEYPLVIGAATLIWVWLARATWRRRDLWLALALATAVVVPVLALRAQGVRERVVELLIVVGIPAIVCIRSFRVPARFALSAVVMLVAAEALHVNASGQLLTAKRGFFGIHRVVERADGGHLLMHGNIVHGVQLHADARPSPVGYYNPAGPFGQVFNSYAPAGTKARVAVVGLGAGALACFLQPGQTWTFYELDPLVAQIARDGRYFTFLRDCAPRAKIVLGDARLTLANAPAGSYDLIVLDAYSSDSIPVHLVTREALALYREKLAPGGKLVFHISNRYLRLEPILGALAADAGLASRTRYDQLEKQPDDLSRLSTRVTVMARSEAELGALAHDPRWHPTAIRPNIGIWTDDYSSILNALNFFE